MVSKESLFKLIRAITNIGDYRCDPLLFIHYRGYNEEMKKKLKEYPSLYSFFDRIERQLTKSTEVVLEIVADFINKIEDLNIKLDKGAKVRIAAKFDDLIGIVEDEVRKQYGSCDKLEELLKQYESLEDQK